MSLLGGEQMLAAPPQNNQEAQQHPFPNPLLGLAITDALRAQALVGPGGQRDFAMPDYAPPDWGQPIRLTHIRC